jgi:ubiquinone/menaquinone biosynthesis C-methylase UbiE
MPGYYAKKLAAERLRACYELAPPATRAYLEGEIGFVVSRITPADDLLELGCGYGRVLRQLLPHARSVWGIDSSEESLRLARDLVGPARACRLAAMDAGGLAFAGASFDRVICIQNGISAFAVDPRALFREAVRVARRGGRVLFSSYAERFWPHRLEWFEAQAAAGLIGEIDRLATGDGVIVCRDGFRSTTTRPADFRELAASVGLELRIVEVGGASLFCELRVP